MDVRSHAAPGRALPPDRLLARLTRHLALIQWHGDDRGRGRVRHHEMRPASVGQNARSAVRCSNPACGDSEPTNRRLTRVPLLKPRSRSHGGCSRASTRLAHVAEPCISQFYFCTLVRDTPHRTVFSVFSGRFRHSQAALCTGIPIHACFGASYVQWNADCGLWALADRVCGRQR